MNYEQKHKSIKENVKNGNFFKCIKEMTEWQVYIYTLFYFILFHCRLPSFYCSLKYVVFFYCYYIKLRAHHKFL